MIEGGAMKTCLAILIAVIVLGVAAGLFSVWLMSYRPKPDISPPTQETAPTVVTLSPEAWARLEQLLGE